jgi:2-polyprenyl-3-methyl-5-hydroxy-6-metoxy-1,4-benzoquinol methylase
MPWSVKKPRSKPKLHFGSAPQISSEVTPVRRGNSVEVDVLDEGLSLKDRVMKLSDFFRILPPHERMRTAEEVSCIAQEVEEILKSRGPRSWYARTELVKGSGIFTEPSAMTFDEEAFLGGFQIDRNYFSGKRVLDIGAFAGTMTFFAEDCGATVVSVDVQDPETNGFALLHELRSSTATHVMCSVYDLHPDLFGVFDTVIFSGVHYHLRHPILAMERLNSVLKGSGDFFVLGTVGDMWLHAPDTMGAGVNPSLVARSSNANAMSVPDLNHIPIAGFYRGDYAGDRSNWFIPNTLALSEMIKSCGFDVLYSNSYAMSRPTLDFGNIGSIATGFLKCRKNGVPDTEFDRDVYHNVRVVEASANPTIENLIPTRFELERARRTSVRASDS